MIDVDMLFSGWRMPGIAQARPAERGGAICTPLQLAPECLRHPMTKIKNPLIFRGFRFVPASFPTRERWSIESRRRASNWPTLLGLHIELRCAAEGAGVFPETRSDVSRTIGAV
jgi:hypothetical protein